MRGGKVKIQDKLLVFTFTLFLFLVGLSTVAETVEKDQGYISVSLSSTKEVSPNQAEISIGIETYDKSLQKASAENKAIANKVYSSLKAILSSEDYIKTNDYSANPIYIYTKDNKKVLDKYVVSNTVSIKTKKTELASKLIDTAIAQGATNVKNLQFSTVDYDNSCNDALAELTKKTYAQANSVAKSINAHVIGVRSINATCSSDNPKPFYGMVAKSLNDTVSSTPIESGKVRIYANIDASFYVK